MIRKVILVLGKTGTGKSSFAKELLTRSPRTISLDPLLEYGGTPFDNSLDMIETAKENSTSFHYSLQTVNEHHFTAVCKLCWILGNVLFVVEEADLYLEGKNRYFNSLIDQGRHRNVHILCIVRRTPEINKNFRAQQTSLITFFQDEPIDLEHLRLWGFDETKVKNLIPRKYPEPLKESVHYAYIGERPSQIKFEISINLSKQCTIQV
jgi:hypothetical protein